MAKHLVDADAKKERDLQLDIELEGTFPASDPLKITRFPVAMHTSKTTRLTSSRTDRSRVRSTGRTVMDTGRKYAGGKVAADRIRLKRAYEPPASDDGTRILIDRLWPRGVRKAAAEIDEWMKEIAPSTELRKWFGHDPARWPEFRRRYRSEIQRHEAELGRLRELARNGPVTLVYSAHDAAHNDAVVLKCVLLNGD